MKGVLLIDRAAAGAEVSEMVHILLVDDEAVVRTTVRLMLESRGYQISEAEDGQAGLDLLNGAAVDLAILDMHMPGMNGPALADAIRARFPAVAIVFLSGSIDVDDVGLGGSYASVLQKPVRLAALHAAIEAAMATIGSTPSATG
jgi:CheY-like chemotaxis protein